MTSSFTKMAACSRELRNANRSDTPSFSQLRFYFSARGLRNSATVGALVGEVVDLALWFSLQLVSLPNFSLWGPGTGDQQLLRLQRASGKLTCWVNWKSKASTKGKRIQSILSTSCSSVSESWGPIWLAFFTSSYCSPTHSMLELPRLEFIATETFLPGRAEGKLALSSLYHQPSGPGRRTHCFKPAEGRGLKGLVFLKGPRAV